MDIEKRTQNLSLISEEKALQFKKKKKIKKKKIKINKYKLRNFLKKYLRLKLHQRHEHFRLCGPITRVQ